MGLATFLRTLAEGKRFRQLPSERRKFVFYAENGTAWSHLGPIVEHLTEVLGQPVCYVTSSEKDPILGTENTNLDPFFIGDGTACTYFFMNLQADLAIMTMPDLESFHKKRSRIASVHYVYVFHSLVSTHMIYQPGAFDHYDSIFAAGPHHRTEIRATEQRHQLGEKHVFDIGYGRLDSILGAEQSRRSSHNDIRRILVAPSWGPEGLLETRGEELTEALLAAGFHVTVRPHPETGRRWPRALRGLQKFRANDRFELETDIRSQDSLLSSDLMISDWSGAALEYAFGLERPVLFIDVPRKINNPSYEEIGHEPIEVSIREKIGTVLAPDNMSDIGSTIEALLSTPDEQRSQIRRVRDETVFNLGSSAEVGAETLLQLASELGERDTQS